MKILIIEDEPELREVVQHFLERELFLVEYAADYQSGLDKIISYEYDCILLDIMLPDGNGMDLLKELKKLDKKDPVIILSAKDSVDDKVSGLEIGADDYLAKPFHLAELLARIKSVIRRKNQDGENKLHYRNISVYPDSRKVIIDDNELVLNRKEYDVLYYFMVNPEKTLQKTMLAEAIWGDYIDQADSYDFIYSQIKNLRRKLKDNGAKADLQAVYGIGYKLIS
ncbi:MULTISPECIES: response regulator transcription factor [Chryseobacterium]|uniref:DNA-binding response OmpR family regulator n=1 Tax=Chryseobacterium camelliae TaxID=1265445 RepID=A0ABU0TMD3_9FLAO|nr:MULTISPECIES: response regulator transcription factor [Chryseobacterium]MDT3408195.1 DNA-binding response OmpR family regulator [Pseudacidovorax intermedius]MDQ1097951.1 DNA-binding response OmpR family regulator [Chryseobacterium camelliae]MDQ1101882.1 DNA-binding response OmpR family regulator [Chryseobacterium sp. SORGH_AS_1048]MDR6085322.1 DNA-binding response OmpR family regulator [Chryseobacterium sp. SORGH_AS_0909]MDR6129679.1 DNA-binding response OmpR family regulator [Chryseobacter